MNFWIFAGFTPLDEFRQIGRDYEYCPEEPDVMAQTKANQKRKKKNKKPLATECVFCKNNDQPQSVYKSHILKNADGDVVCPILRYSNSLRYYAEFFLSILSIGKCCIEKNSLFEYKYSKFF